MTKRSGQIRRRRGRFKLWWVAAGAAVALLAWSVWSLRSSGGADGSVQPISRLRTQDFHSLVFSGSEPETVYFGHHGGMLVSRNGGLEWRPTSFQNADAMSLAAPPSDTQILYAAGHNVFFKSVDGGQSWQPVGSDLPGLDIHGFAADPDQPDLLYAHAVGFGIFRSEDGGEAWESRSSGISALNLAVGETAEVVFAAAAQSGLLQSSDGARTWSQLAAPPGEGVIAVAFDRAAGRLYATTFGEGAGLYRWSEDGRIWEPLIQGATLLAVAVSPHNPDHLISVDDSGGVYASRDGGATWSNQ